MSKADAWLGSSATLNDVVSTEQRANDTARRIAEKPSTITLTRGSSQLAAQTMRLDPSNSPGQAQDRVGDVNRVAMTGLLVMGYKDHATIADTNIKRGDKFFHESHMYEVIDITPTYSGRILAFASGVR